MLGNSALIVIHNELGSLYEVDPATGHATLLYGPPDDPPLQGPDGMSRLGRTLCVVEDGASRISVMTLDPSTGMGTLQKVLPVVGAQTPTTSALFGSAVSTVEANWAPHSWVPTRSSESGADEPPAPTGVGHRGSAAIGFRSSSRGLSRRVPGSPCDASCWGCLPTVPGSAGRGRR